MDTIRCTDAVLAPYGHHSDAALPSGGREGGVAGDGRRLHHGSITASGSVCLPAKQGRAQPRSSINIGTTCPDGHPSVTAGSLPAVGSLWADGGRCRQKVPILHPARPVSRHSSFMFRQQESSWCRCPRSVRRW